MLLLLMCIISEKYGQGEKIRISVKKIIENEEKS